MPGIHHVTTISGKPTRNLDFYTRILGLRFVKKTVNFDDPGTYHLYYGDEVGHPGTILTFFPWEHAVPGRTGVGFAQETAFRVPVTSLGYWTHRLVEKGVEHGAIERRVRRRAGRALRGPLGATSLHGAAGRDHVEMGRGIRIPLDSGSR